MICLNLGSILLAIQRLSGTDRKLDHDINLPFKREENFGIK